MQKIADTDAKLEEIRRQDEMIRTFDDLLRVTGLQDEGIECTVSLDELYTSLNPLPGDKKGTDGGRTRCIARLKDGGVVRLPHRQKMASELSKARREARLRPAKATLPAPDGGDVAAAPSVAKPLQTAHGADVATPNSGEPSKGKKTPITANLGDPKTPTPRPASIANPMQEAMLAGLAAPGQRVQITGLSARPELNGKCGAITSYSSDRGRYFVVIHADGNSAGDGETLALRPQNLELAALSID